MRKIEIVDQELIIVKQALYEYKESCKGNLVLYNFEYETID